MQLSLIPQPQKIRVGNGYFTPPSQGVIGLADHSLYAAALRLRQFFAGYAVSASREGLKDTIRLRLATGLKCDGYRLAIGKQGILIEGASVAAVYYGLQTLRQIVEQAAAGRLPIVTIEDWADFPDRGVYYDVTRGRVPKLEQLKRMADTLSQYKINQLQLYVEHTFAYRGHPAIGSNASPLTAEDILELDAYCRERHVELVPSQASFGHLHTVLDHPQYRHLAEDWGKGKYITPDKTIRNMLQQWIDEHHQCGFTLSPANPETYSFLDSLFAEYLPLFSSGRFNACCDETLDLGYGQSYELCQKIGRGKLYLGHIRKLNDLSRKYGKRLMIWGDIIRHYPELIPEIPKDVTVLDWGYEHNHNFEAIHDFKKAGLAFYACPSTSSYCTLFPMLPKAATNIAGFAAAAFKHGGQGLLNTEWGDGGHYNLMEHSWHGFVFGAEQGWNTKAERASFTRRFCQLFLKTNDPKMAWALTELGDISHLDSSPFYQSLWKHIFFANEKKPVFPLGMRCASVGDNGTVGARTIKLDADFGRQTMRRLDKVSAVFEGHCGRRGEDPVGVLPYWLFAADTIRHAARKLTVVGENGKNTAAERSKLIVEMKELRKRFRQLWLARNHVSEIQISMDAYQEAIQALRRNKLSGVPPLGCTSKILLSKAMPGAGDLKSLAYPAKRAPLGLKLRDFGSGNVGGCVFYDLHNEHFNCAPRDTLAYFVRPFTCPRPMRFEIGLGYDGPVKAWVDGKLVFHDPKGTNPAIADKAVIAVNAEAGEHELVVALGSNHGKAWGLLLRFKGKNVPETVWPKAEAGHNSTERR